MPLPSRTLRALVPVAALAVAALVVACTTDPAVAVHPPDVPREAQRVTFDPWSPPTNCIIGKHIDYLLGTPLPTVDSTCGVRWSMYYPPQHDPPTYYWAIQWDDLYLPFAPLNALWTISLSSDPVVSSQNGPLEITFDKPVSLFAMQVQEIDYPGHRMEAFDSVGHKVAEADFDPPVPGARITSERTLTAPGIRRVVVYPAIISVARDTAVENVYYRAAFQPDTTCPPSGEPALDSAKVRASMFDALEKALADPMLRERGGVWYEVDDTVGTGTVWEELKSNGPATECSLIQIVVKNVPGVRALFTYHAHSLTPPNLTTTCPGVPPGTTVAEGPSGCRPGQTTCDFNASTQSGVPMYVIDRHSLYRIQPNATNRNTGSFEKKWKADRGKRCFQT